MADYEPILKSRRYVLGETDSFYGVWDTQGGTDALEQFPLTQEGFERAEAKLRELKRRDRRERGVLYRVLWGVLLAGLALSVVTGLVDLSAGLVVGTPFSSKLFEVSYALGSLGTRMVVGGLFALAGLTLIQRQTVASGSQVVPPGRDIELPHWERVARWIGTVALGIWAASAIATQLLFRPPFFGVSTDSPVDKPVLIAYMVESLAFRIWVAAFVLLAAAWGRRSLLRRDGSAVTPE